MYFPSKPPTPSEYKVLVVAASAFFILIGIAGFIVAFRASPEKHDLAISLMHYSGWSLVMGIGIAVAFWLFRRLVD